MVTCDMVRRLSLRFLSVSLVIQYFDLDHCFWELFSSFVLGVCLHTLVLTFALDCRLVLSTVSTFARSTSQHTVSPGVVYVAGIGQPGIPMSIR